LAIHQQDFLEAKEAVSFFVGIQIGYFASSEPTPIPAEGSTMLTNSQTHEQMSITVRKPSEQFRGCLENRTVENRTVSGINGHKSTFNKYPEIILRTIK
jgi:hypothetical protein